MQQTFLDARKSVLIKWLIAGAGVVLFSLVSGKILGFLVFAVASVPFYTNVLKESSYENEAYSSEEALAKNMNQRFVTILAITILLVLGFSIFSSGV